VASYIPANVISITDGQIYLEPSLFFTGARPAINVGLSVSRVGGNAQTRAMRKVAGRLRIDLAQYRDLESFVKFGTELDKASQAQITRGSRVVEVLKQDQFQPMPLEDQVMVINAGAEGLLDDLPVDKIRAFERDFLKHVHEEHPQIGKEIANTRDLDDDTQKALNEATRLFKQQWNPLLEKP
jgi:F-type H+-transporting ATPase subunit alpha